MQGIEAITAAILASAKAEAEETVKQAEEYKAARLAELEARFESRKTELETRLAAEAENVVTRRLTLAGLEARMSKLGAKQTVVSEAYALALKKAAALDQSKYRGFYARLVASVAVDGDGVLVAAPDVKRLDKTWLEGVAKQSGKKLMLLDGMCEASGGVIIVGKVSETDLTLDTLVSELKQQSESDVLAALFGETV